MKSDFKSMLSVFLNSEAILQKEFFLQCQLVNQQFCIGVLRVFMEAVGRKCPTSSVHRTDFCIMTTRHATQIHCFSRCPSQERLWWYVASLLLHLSLHGLFWFSKIETWLKGWRFKDITKTAESLAALEHNAKQEFHRCFQLWERHWIMCLTKKGIPLNETVLNCN